MTWRISGSRPITGSILPSLARCVRLIVNWSSAGVLPPPGRGRPGVPGWPGAAAVAVSEPSSVPAVIDGSSFCSVSAEILPQLGRQLFQLGSERAVADQGGDQVPAADLRRAELDRRHQPGLLHQVEQPLREGRLAGVARLQAVERPRQVAIEPRRIDLEPLEDRFQVGAARFEQLHQPVLDLDVVVGPRQAQPGGAFQGPAAMAVELADERTLIDEGHGRASPWAELAEEISRPDM